MKVQPLTNQQAIDRLQAEEMRLLRDNHPSDAAQMVENREILAKGRGDDLWDVFRNAHEAEAKWDKVKQAITPEDSSEVGFYGAFAGFVAAGAVGSAVGNYLHTGNLGQSLLLSLIPVATGLLGALIAFVPYEDEDIDLSRPIGGVIAATSIAAMASHHWLPPVAAGLATIGASVAIPLVAAHKSEQNRRIQEVIETNKKLLETPLSPSAKLGSAISKRDVLGTLSRLEAKAVEESNYTGAVTIHEDLERLGDLKGDTFHDMFVASRGHEKSKNTLIRYADKILEDARQRDEIDALLKGNPSATQLLVEEEAIEVGDQRLPVVTQ
ncbi:MAG: hypothetical protein AB7S38_11465 [Vulcanimicrobiota bacterium]